MIKYELIDGAWCLDSADLEDPDVRASLLEIFGLGVKEESFIYKYDNAMKILETI